MAIDPNSETHHAAESLSSQLPYQLSSSAFLAPIFALTREFKNKISLSLTSREVQITFLLLKRRPLLPTTIERMNVSAENECFGTK